MIEWTRACRRATRAVHRWKRLSDSGVSAISRLKLTERPPRDPDEDIVAPSKQPHDDHVVERHDACAIGDHAAELHFGLAVKVHAAVEDVVHDARESNVDPDVGENLLSVSHGGDSP